jgi:hypothetical protein
MTGELKPFGVGVVTAFFVESVIQDPKPGDLTMSKLKNRW